MSRLPRSAPAVNGNGDGAHSQRNPYRDISDLPLPRQAPHNLEAEQALLGAILVNNEAHDRVSGFLEPTHFFDPLHAQIYETALAEIRAGRRVTPITLKTFFESAEPIGSGQTVPQYLGWLAANATTIVNVRDYARTIYDLATCRQMIVVGEDMVAAAYDGRAQELGEAQERLGNLQAAVSATADTDHASQATWPVLDPKAMHGIAGELAQLATAHTEADPVAVLATALTWAGAMFGRTRMVRVGDDLHHPRLFSALVGASSRARKGTSTAPVRAVMEEADRLLDDGSPLRVRNGLSTGEGLIAAVQDPEEGTDDGAVASDPVDKRLMVIESELGRVLRAASRHGSTMSAVMRSAWDGVSLGIMTKTASMTASDPHVAVLGHVTRTELAELLETDDIWNGFANRILWLCVRRRAILPFPSGLSGADRESLAEDVSEAVGHARSAAQSRPALTFTADARELWRAEYPRLTTDLQGVLGVVTARAEAQVLRLALVYALLDRADGIWSDHLEAAIALHQYAVDSARFIFATSGEVPRDPVAERIVTALQAGPKSQTELRDLFSRNLQGGQLAAALQGLQERGQISSRAEGTGGRPRLIWSLSPTTKTT